MVSSENESWGYTQHSYHYVAKGNTNTTPHIMLGYITLLTPLVSELLMMEYYIIHQGISPNNIRGLATAVQYTSLIGDVPMY